MLMRGFPVRVRARVKALVAQWVEHLNVSRLLVAMNLALHLVRETSIRLSIAVKRWPKKMHYSGQGKSISCRRSHEYYVEGFGLCIPRQHHTGRTYCSIGPTRNPIKMPGRAETLRKYDGRQDTEPSNYALFPIYGFQVYLVSVPDVDCTFTSGAGTLTYSVSPGVLSVQTANICGGPPQWQTAENSNVVYQEGVWPASGSTVRQSFAVQRQG
jgi:hypothetical protein